MTAAEIAADLLGVKSRELAEAIALLPKLVSRFDQHMQVRRIKTLRAERDAAARAYRTAATGEAQRD